MNSRIVIAHTSGGFVIANLMDLSLGLDRALLPINSSIICLSKAIHDRLVRLPRLGLSSVAFQNLPNAKCEDRKKVDYPKAVSNRSVAFCD